MSQINVPEQDRPNFVKRQLKTSSGFLGSAVGFLGDVASAVAPEVDNLAGNATGMNLSGASDLRGGLLKGASGKLKKYSEEGMVKPKEEDIEGLYIGDGEEEMPETPGVTPKFKVVTEDEQQEELEPLEDTRMTIGEAETAKPMGELEELEDVQLERVGSDRLTGRSKKDNIGDLEDLPQESSQLDLSQIVSALSQISNMLGRINGGIADMIDINKNIKLPVLSTNISPQKQAGDLISRAGNAAIDKTLSIF
jgi:hypothetical protein